MRESAAASSSVVKGGRTSLPIRIVFCVDTMGLGGTELNAVRVAERLDRKRFDISVACFREEGPIAARYRDAGIRVDTFPLRSVADASGVREGVRFASMLVRQCVRIVHAHDRYTNVFAVPWARLVGTRGVLASRRWGRMEHGHVAANRVAYRLAHGVVANSSAVRDLLVSDDGVSPERIHVIPNFVDDSAFRPPPCDWIADMRHQLRLEPESLVVGVVARLSPIKELPLLLRAFAALAAENRHLRLVLFGDGPEEAMLHQLAAELGIVELVRFAGERANVPNLHLLFDISALTSRSEGFPNSLVEAMAAGRPVVATSVGGVVDAVQHEVTGLLVPPGDVAALTFALRRLIASSELRQRMGEAGRKYARTAFHMDSVIPALESVYERIAAGAKG